MLAFATTAGTGVPIFGDTHAVCRPHIPRRPGCQDAEDKYDQRGRAHDPEPPDVSPSCGFGKNVIQLQPQEEGSSAFEAEHQRKHGKEYGQGDHDCLEDADVSTNSKMGTVSGEGGNGKAHCVWPGMPRIEWPCSH